MAGARFSSEFLSPLQFAELVQRVEKDAKEGRAEEAWEGVQSMLPAARRQEFVAAGIAYLMGAGGFSQERSLEILEQVYEAQRQSETVLAVVGAALDSARNVDFLNAPPPESPLFAAVVTALHGLSERNKGSATEVELLEGLATAARMMARQHDDLVEMACRRLIELQPDNAGYHYNFGLFLKTRGRFREGMELNQAAVRLASEPHEAYAWNLGICATGVGEAAVALEVWKRLQNKLEIGRFGLPDGRYPECKVRLARRPLAERAYDTDNPGSEESVWIERLSPCHGIIRSILYGDLGVDYGDVVLFDGAPITYQTHGEQRIPVFPHLTTLRHNRYQRYDFAGTQEQAGQIHDLDMPGDTAVYSHTENFVRLCRSCWENPDIDHEHVGPTDKHVVVGRIAAPPDLDPRELLSQLDAAVAERASCRIYVPDLCEAAGFPERAQVERRRFNLIRGN